MLFQINIRQIRRGKDSNLTGGSNFWRRKCSVRDETQNFLSYWRGGEWKTPVVIGNPGQDPKAIGLAIEQTLSTATVWERLDCQMWIADRTQRICYVLSPNATRAHVHIAVRSAQKQFDNGDQHNCLPTSAGNKALSAATMNTVMRRIKTFRPTTNRTYYSGPIV